MVTLADSLVSSSSRPLSLRMRPDLTARRHRYHGRVFWVVKEPVGLNYFRFHEEEYAILTMLDGKTSMEEIKERFEEEFTPQKLTYQDLQQFIGMLHRSGLVISSVSGQGRQLRKRRDEKKRKEWLGKFANVFALRYRGIDPERILNVIYPYTGWFFSVPAIIFNMLFAFSALMLVAVQFDVFRSRLPTFHEFFGAHNWIYMALTMAIVKVLHEFGHGLSCKHYGGECHEMGFMLLVFTPALYCNVSDSWMLPNKWHRAFIGAAGMYVEVVIASIATYIWWFSEPGLLNHLALSVMFICSVSTLLFNGNPLLRFDGYYILMDITEIPNLRQKSTEVLKRFLTHLCLGIEQPENPFLPQSNRFVFGLYTVAAVIYRWVVVLGILMFLNKVLEPYGLKVIGQAIAMVGFFGLIVQPLWKLGKFFYTPGRMHKVKKHRLIATCCVLAGALAVVIFLPLPFHVDCTFELVPRNAESVYVEVPGKLVEVYVRPGQTVQAQQAIAKLKNVDMELKFENLQGQLHETEAQLSSLRKQRHHDQTAGLRIELVRKRQETIKEQLREHEAEIKRLDIVSPAGGVVIPPPIRPVRDTGDGRLPGWSGTPFDAKNQGAIFAESDLICRVGDPQYLEAQLVIDQGDIELVRLGHQVDMMLDAYAGTTLSGDIEQISEKELSQTPAALSSQAGGTLDTVTDKSGVARPMSTSYQARVPLEDSDRIMRVGMRGQAKIYTGWQPLGSRLYRFLARTFHFQL